MGPLIQTFQRDTLAVEIEWRLGSQYWRKGYTIEGAKSSLTSMNAAFKKSFRLRYLLMSLL
ncbi:MAG: GNAT family N-acetyltransferase [Candidatus Midichloria sp.]|nr:GNAT family N-acetyltransferase [Candidatus Midichloria sp.]